MGRPSTINLQLLQLLLQEPFLGKIPDRLIADKYEITPQMVCYVRRKSGIKASHIHCIPYCGITKISDEMLETEVIPILGKRSDADIGRKYGVTRERIRQLRKVFGIPVYRKSMHYFHNYAT